MRTACILLKADELLLFLSALVVVPVCRRDWTSGGSRPIPALRACEKLTIASPGYAPVVDFGQWRLCGSRTNPRSHIDSEILASLAARDELH